MRHTFSDFYFLINKPPQGTAPTGATNTFVNVFLDFFYGITSFIPKIFLKPKFTVKSNWIQTRVFFFTDAASAITVNQTLDVFNVVTGTVEAKRFDSVYLNLDNRGDSVSASGIAGRNFLDRYVVVPQYGSVTFLLDMENIGSDDWNIRITCVHDYEDKSVSTGGGIIPTT